LGLLAVLATAVAAARAAGPKNGAAEGPRLVKYAQLGEVIKQNRGKVIVVDFWNIY
jgi:hypothetical protein